MLHQAKTRVLLLTLCLVCALSATACGVSSSAAAGQPAGPALHVTFLGRPPTHHILLDKDVRDASAVQHLYDAALALLPPKPGIYNCPSDDGTMYHLVFSGVQGQVHTMDLKAAGCPTIQLLETNDTRWMDQAFLTLFEKTIGVSQLDPTAP